MARGGNIRGTIGGGKFDPSIVAPDISQGGASQAPSPNGMQQAGRIDGDNQIEPERREPEQREPERREPDRREPEQMEPERRKPEQTRQADDRQKRPSEIAEGMDKISSSSGRDKMSDMTSQEAMDSMLDAELGVLLAERGNSNVIDPELFDPFADRGLERKSKRRRRPANALEEDASSSVDSQQEMSRDDLADPEEHGEKPAAEERPSADRKPRRIEKVGNRHVDIDEGVVDDTVAGVLDQVEDYSGVTGGPRPSDVAAAGEIAWNASPSLPVEQASASAIVDEIIDSPPEKTQVPDDYLPLEALNDGLSDGKQDERDDEDVRDSADGNQEDGGEGSPKKKDKKKEKAPRVNKKAIDAKTPPEVSKARFAKMRQQASNDISRGFLDLKLDKDGNMGEGVSRAILDLAGVYDIDVEEDASTLFAMVRVHLSLSVDTDDKWFGDKKWRKNGQKVPDWVVAHAMTEMAENQRETGWPFRMPERQIEFGDVNRYPCTAMTKEMFEVLSKSPKSLLHGMSITEAKQIAALEWKKVQMRMMSAGIEYKQRSVIENMQFVLCNEMGLDTDACNLVTDKYRTIDEVLTSNVVEASTIEDGDVRQAYIRAEAERRRTFEEISKTRMGRRRLGGEDPDGAYTVPSDVRENLPEAMLRTMTSVARTMSIIDPTLVAGSVLEKVSGTMTHYAASRVMFIGQHDFAPLNDTKSAMNDPRLVEMMETYISIASCFGQNALIKFCASGLPANKDGAAKFAKQWTKTPGSKSVRNMRKFNGWVSGKVGSAFGADWVMRGSDMARFLDNYMLRQAEKKRRGENDFVTADELNTAMVVDPVTAFYQMMSSMDGVRAFSQMRARTNGGNTILSEPVAEFFRRHGVCDAVFALVFREKFLTYGIRATEKWMPMLNTFQLIAYKTGAAATGKDIDQLKYSEMLVSKSFRDCVILDVANLATCFGKFVVANAIIAMLGGLEPPDDPEKEGMWDEWKIAGVPWRMAWWLDDVLTWSAPMAIAFNAEKVKPGTGWKVFMDGMSDTLLGQAPFDVLEMMLNFDEEIVQSQRLADYKNAAGPSSDMEFYMTQMAVTGIEALNDMFGIRFVNDMLRMGTSTDDYDHSYNVVYSKNTEDDKWKVEGVGFFESQMRRQTAKNPVLGFIMNVATGYYTQDPTQQKTGWMYNEQPIATVSDATGLYCYDRFRIDLMDGDITNPASSEERIQVVVDDVISNVIGYFDSPMQAAASGIVLSKEARYYTGSYLEAQKNAITNAYYERVATPGEFSSNGLSYEENVARKNDWWNECEAMKAEIDKKLDFLWSKYIPTDIPKYARWRTDWQDEFTLEDGTKTDKFGYMANLLLDKIGMGQEIEHEVVPYGDFRNPFPMFHNVEDVQRVVTGQDASGKDVTQRTYDYQTPTVWWSSTWSDWDKINGFYGESVVPQLSAMFGGQKVMDLLTGGGMVSQGNGRWADAAVLGTRAYTAINPEAYDPIKPDASDPNLWTGNVGDDGKLKDWSKDKSPSGGSPYYRRYGRRGGGGGYSPKIYSNPRSINVDRGSTMYTKKPYNAQTSYLRPAVYTKGSREAYRRQDM